METKGDKLRVLEAEIARLSAQREALSNRIEGLSFALKLIAPDTLKSNSSVNLVEYEGRGRRGVVKSTVLDVVKNAGERGTSVTEVVQEGIRHGTKLDKATVSSLLSRLKAANILTHNGERYIFNSFPNSRELESA